MSAYHPPTHNRLLDLEHHLQGQRPDVATMRQQSTGLSNQGRSPSRRAIHNQPTPRLSRQSAPKPQSIADPRRSPLGQTASPPQFSRSGAQPRVRMDGAASSQTGQNPRPVNARGINRGGQSGSYRQLAAHLGRYTRLNSVARSPQNDLPVIPTPISPEIVEAFSAPPPLATRHKQTQRASAPPVAPPLSKPASPPLQPNWKALAMTIRQARLGRTPESLAAAQTHTTENDWAIDDIFTEDFDSINSALAVGDCNEPAAPLDGGRLNCNELSSRQTSDEPISPTVAVEVISPAEERVIEISASPITIDVIPIDSLAGELNAEAIEFQVVDSGFHTVGLKDGVLLLTYQLACPPQIIQYLAQLQRPKHQRKRSVSVGLGQQPSRPRQLNAS
ncbi:MAG: hypothetical protein QNJ46_05785 [Leptolyngbyaceae cyanobacterium MO_188.B28]|nr:hypothetical protein [Leptolyngbyaceae cyanobacterium MO_188.B28]